MGGLEGGAGNEGMGGGREKAGGGCCLLLLLELPAESVRGGGLFDVGDCFCIRSGPTVGVFASLSYRRKSSSSGLPCLRPSIVRDIVSTLVRFKTDVLSCRQGRRFGS